MNYYDYSSYFRQITTDLDSIQSKQDELQTQFTELRTEIGEKLDTIDNSIRASSIFLGAVLIVSLCFRVFFKC